MLKLYILQYFMGIYTSNIMLQLTKNIPSLCSLLKEVCDKNPAFTFLPLIALILWIYMDATTKNIAVLYVVTHSSMESEGII